MDRPGRIACMLFDLDGTLLDTAADFFYVVEQLCLENEHAPPSMEEVHRTVSSGARALVNMAFRLEDSSRPEASALATDLHRRLLELYAEQITQTRATLYPGMQALLDELQRCAIPWGIVTNKPELYARPLLARLGMDASCSVLICPDHVTHSKPHPEPLLLANSILNVSAQESVYVGDHPRDIESGKRAGMFTIAARYGYLEIDPPIETWGADLIADTVPDITRWLLQ